MAEEWEDDGGHLEGGNGGGDEQEWRSRQRRFHTLGYRDGVSAGKKSSAQRGFNAGFALSPELREILSPEEAVRDKLMALHGTVSSISSKDAVQSFYKHLLQQQGGDKVAQLEECKVEIWPIVSEVRAQAAAVSIDSKSKLPL